MNLPSRETLASWDQRYVWHPFTPHSVYQDEDPLMVVAGEGHYLIDADGRRLLDGVGSIWCSLFGHRRSEIDDAVRRQLDRIAHSTFLGNASAPAVMLAKRLVELAPGDLSRVFYSDDGSTAVEAALKIALQYWQQQPDPAGRARRNFLTLEEAYHGDTVGAVSLGGIDLFHARYERVLFDTIKVPSPGAPGALEAFERTADEHGAELAAIVIEPGFQGASGILTQPEGFLRLAREVADRTGALLIFDEVAAGMGRTGTLFACQREGVAPDILCLAKGLTGGYLPLAATLATERVFAAFLGPPEQGRTFFHGHTYTGNQLGAAAALATLDLFESERILHRVQHASLLMAEQLEKLAECPHVREVRQCGLAVGIELVERPAALRNGMRVCLAARARGVFLRPLGDVVVLMPPLTLTDSELIAMVDAVRFGIDRVFGADA